LPDLLELVSEIPNLEIGYIYFYYFVRDLRDSILAASWAMPGGTASG
jgi:hypothetical protein